MLFLTLSFPTLCMEDNNVQQPFDISHNMHSWCYPMVIDGAHFVQLEQLVALLSFCQNCSIHSCALSGNYEKFPRSGSKQVHKHFGPTFSVPVSCLGT